LGIYIWMLRPPYQSRRQRRQESKSMGHHFGPYGIYATMCSSITICLCSMRMCVYASSGCPVQECLYLDLASNSPRSLRKARCATATAAIAACERAACGGSHGIDLAIGDRSLIIVHWGSDGDCRHCVSLIENEMPTRCPLTHRSGPCLLLVATTTRAHLCAVSRERGLLKPLAVGN
jgi:hypothetical protein